MKHGDDLMPGIEATMRETYRRLNGGPGRSETERELADAHGAGRALGPGGPGGDGRDSLGAGADIAGLEAHGTATDADISIGANAGGSEADAAPGRWAEAEKTALADLPPEVQASVSRREHDRERAFTQRTQELAARHPTYAALEEHIGPRRQAWAAEGWSEPQAIGHLLALSDFAATDPAGFIQWFQGTRGLGAGARPGASATGMAGLAPLPSAGHLAGHNHAAAPGQGLGAASIGDSTGMLDSRPGPRDSRGAGVWAEIAGLGAQPDYPFLHEVSSEMANLMAAGITRDAAQAYEYAVWGNPAARARLMAARNEADETTRLGQRRAEAKAARRAAGTDLAPRSSPQSDEPATSMRETMREAYRRAQRAA